MPDTKKKRAFLKTFVPPMVVLVVLFVGLELACIFFDISDRVLPRPTEIVTEVFTSFTTGGDLPKDYSSTVSNMFMGYLIAVPLGMVLAALLAQSNTVYRTLSPIVIMLVTTPMMVLVPILVVWMGFTRSVRILAVVIQATPIILLNTLAGFTDVERDKLEIARLYGATRAKLFFKIILPQALPRIFTGLRLGVINATLGIIATEFVVGTVGLGYRVQMSCAFFNTAMAYGCIILIAVTARLLMAVVTTIERRVIIWKVN